jgi:hypothetical protein
MLLNPAAKLSMRRSGSILPRSVTHAVTHPPNSAPGRPAAITANAVRPTVATMRPAPSSLPLSSAPTANYRQHHDVVAPQIDAASFRPSWLVQTRLWSLLEAGKIDRAELDAGLAWRRWAEVIAPTKVQSWEVRVDAPVGPGDGGMAYRVDAASRLRQAAAAVGPLRIAILEACVLRDHAWLQLARLLRVSDKTAKDRAVEAIAALAAWRAGETVPPSPALRFRNQPGRL